MYTEFLAYSCYATQSKKRWGQLALMAMPPEAICPPLWFRVMLPDATIRQPSASIGTRA